ncbi:MAG: hypothetical protein AAF554_12385 [Bacteroidota bacterium]
MNKVFEGTVLGLFGQLGNDLSMIKAMNYIQLRHFASKNNMNLELLLKEVEQMHAKYAFALTKSLEEIIEKAQNPDNSDFDISDL